MQFRLEENEQMLRSVVGGNPIPQFVIDREHRIIYWNKALEIFSGISADEVAGTKQQWRAFYDGERPCLADLLLDGATERLADLYPEGNCGPGTMSGSYQATGFFARRGKAGAWLHFSAAVIRDSVGCVLGAVETLEDVTERKRLESELLRAQRVESVGRLANGVAHDLNNVLSPILMLSEVMLQDAAAPDIREMIDAVRRSAQRGADIVRQLLVYSRGSEEKRSELNPCDVVQDTARILQATFPKTIQLRSRLAADLWHINADATQAHQVLLNLCVNARDAMPDGGTLTLSAENLELTESTAKLHPNARSGLYVVLSVSDTGTGMSPEIRERLFDPFFTTKAVGQGTGLGLFTVLGIVQSHGGFVEVESLMGEGSEFRVYLPAHGAGQGLVLDEVAQTAPSGAGELILLVDDEEAIRRSTRKLLERKGYRVMEAGDGFEALGLCSRRKEEIRTIILDMWMPFMDGAVLIRELEKMCPEIPVIVVSGLPGLRADAESASPAVKAFLAKPSTAARLLTTLRKVLDDQKRKP